jgi:hypothetical protein
MNTEVSIDKLRRGWNNVSPRQRKAIAILGGLFAIAVIGSGSHNQPSPPPPLALPAVGEEVPENYVELIRKTAAEPCAQAIEKQALYDFKWSHYADSLRFTSFNKYQRADGTVELSGDAAEMQNGIGNWVRVYYQCNYNPATNQVINVTVNRGRLPW